MRRNTRDDTASRSNKEVQKRSSYSKISPGNEDPHGVASRSTPTLLKPHEVSDIDSFLKISDVKMSDSSVDSDGKGKARSISLGGQAEKPSAKVLRSPRASFKNVTFFSGKTNPDAPSSDHPLRHEIDSENTEQSDESAQSQTQSKNSAEMKLLTDKDKKESPVDKRDAKYILDIDSIVAVGASDNIKKSIQDLEKAKSNVDFDVVEIGSDRRNRSRTFQSSSKTSLEIARNLSLERRYKSVGAVDQIVPQSRSADIDEIIALSTNRPSSAVLVDTFDRFERKFTPGMDVEFVFKVASGSEGGKKNYRDVLTDPQYQVTAREALERVAGSSSPNAGADVDQDPAQDARISPRAKSYKMNLDQNEKPSNTNRNVEPKDNAAHGDIDDYLKLGSHVNEAPTNNLPKRHSLYSAKQESTERMAGRKRSSSDFNKPTLNKRIDDSDPLIAQEKDNKGRSLVK
ncbi:hypothetical protein MP638_007504 [Amoeboaphelidium occidentale]|nr:hypothetical protein MP638_007504 [Amoeboaphelidium occidentale]